MRPEESEKCFLTGTVRTVDAVKIYLDLAMGTGLVNGFG